MAEGRRHERAGGGADEPDLTDLVTRKEAAALLDVSTYTLDRLRGDGVIPTIRVSARGVRFARGDLLEYLRRRRSPPNDSA